MNIASLVSLVKGEPVFSSALLEVAGTRATTMRAQLARWVRTGRLIQLRRRLYVLSATYRGIEPHPFLIANRLQPGSYVSFQSALAFRGLIPEHVPTVTSASTGRPCSYDNPFGHFQFRHIRKTLFCGYERVEVATGQFALIAVAEKALIDLLYITPRSDAAGYAEELRLQSPETFDLDRLQSMASQTGSHKVRRAVRRVCSVLEGSA
ncbi:MAG: hypothetical protein A3K19_05230 [Lentisphaerae bacterium RIFOXYB12_FULL_65_16]|nr:MAG: hypothetical protein A3K18_02610 [Lentisphaerae bacterium RIFOXYA12_64_32]OGV84139.1 MAG: hypothetical protein A3K19_05230 [Lentisphaerae bacterium RIFOXYB12_FULL_65_16]